jgi:transposase
MLGPPKPRRLSDPIAVSLGDLVPPNHFCRDLEAKLDLDFVRDWAQALYAERGRPSIDPVVFLKLQLVKFFEDVRSEHEFIETAGLRLAGRRSATRRRSRHHAATLSANRRAERKPMSWRVAPSSARSARISPTTGANL